MNVLWVGANAMARQREQPGLSCGGCDLSWRTTSCSTTGDLEARRPDQPSSVPPPPGANPCEHAGKCLNTLGSFECQCLQGYTGPRCEIDVNECISNPCQNDATCLDQIGEFQCICMPGMFVLPPTFGAAKSRET